VLKVNSLIFSGFLAFNLLAFFSMFLLRRQLHLIIIIYGNFIATILNSQFVTIFGFNLHMFKTAPGWIPYTEKTLYFLTTCPALTLWLMFILFRPTVPLAIKWLSVLLLTAFHAFVDYWLMFAGYVQLINWNPSYSFIRNFVDAGIVFLLLAGARKLLRRLEVAA
jgi:hypothetical protein